MWSQPYFMKKTFYYNFFPTKEEEETSKARELESGYHRSARHNGRVVVEINDLLPPPPVPHPSNRPWRITKVLTRHEADSSRLVLSCNDTFEHVLRYWPLSLANHIVLGPRVNVEVWDVTQESYPRKYGIEDGYLQMVENDDFSLVCMKLMKDRNLKVYDEIALCWDPWKSVFKFKLLL